MILPFPFVRLLGFFFFSRQARIYGTMASADFSESLDSETSHGKLLYPPQQRAWFTTRPYVWLLDFLIYCSIIQTVGLISYFCSSRLLFCLTLPSDSTSQWTPLRSA